MYGYNYVKLKENAPKINIDTNELSNESIASGTIVRIRYRVYDYPNQYLLVIDNGNESWIKTSNYEPLFDEYDYDVLCSKYVDLSDFVNPENVENNGNTLTQKKNVDENLENGLVYCVIAAVCIFVVAIIVIVFVNKRKKQSSK